MFTLRFAVHAIILGAVLLLTPSARAAQSCAAQLGKCNSVCQATQSFNRCPSDCSQQYQQCL